MYCNRNPPSSVLPHHVTYRLDTFTTKSNVYSLDTLVCMIHPSNELMVNWFIALLCLGCTY